MVAVLFVQDRATGSNVFLHVCPPMAFQQGLLLSQTFAAEVAEKRPTAPKDSITLLNTFTAHYNVVSEVFVVAIPAGDEHALPSLELVRSVKHLLVQSCEGVPKVNAANLQKKFTELFLCIDELVFSGNFPPTAECMEHMLGRRLAAVEPFNPHGEGCRILNIASSNNEIKDSIARHATVTGFEFSFTDEPSECFDRGLLTSSFLTTADGQQGPFVPLRARTGAGEALSPMPASPSDLPPHPGAFAGAAVPIPAPMAPPPGPPPGPPAGLPAGLGDDPLDGLFFSPPPPTPASPPAPVAGLTPTPASQPEPPKLDSSSGSSSSRGHLSATSDFSLDDMLGTPVPAFVEERHSSPIPKQPLASPRSPLADGTESDKVVLPFKAMAQETITASYDTAAASLTAYSLVGELLLNAGKHVVPMSQAGQHPDHTTCAFILKLNHCEGRVEVRPNPAFAKDIGGFQYHCELAIVNSPGLPPAPVPVLKYKTCPGVCPVPIRVKLEWSTIQEPTLTPSDDPFEDAAYVSTDQLVLNWMVNPATPLTALSFLVPANTAAATAINQQSKPPGTWNAEKGNLMWTAISDTETLPGQLMARFKMRSSTNTASVKSARLHPIALRLEGRRNRPLTEVGFSFAVLPPGGGDPTPAEVKGGVGGKYLSTAYTFS